MNTEQKIAVVKKSMKQKICFGLKVAGSEVCTSCPLAAECAPMRVARLTYELQQLEVAVAKPEADAEFEAKMESMSKAKFEAMIDKALSRRAELETMIVKALSREAERKAQVGNATAPGEQQATEDVQENVKGRPRAAKGQAAPQVNEVVQAKVKGRPRTAKEKSVQVLTLAARGVTRQAIANELGISLASVYRILKENS
jgi:transposase